MSQENVEAVRRGFEAFQRGEWELFLQGVDPNIEFVELPAFGTKTYRGHEGLVAAVQWWSSQWDDFHTELTQLIDANDDQVVHVVRNQGRGKLSRVEVAEEVAFLSTIRDGKAIRIEMFRSVSEALEAAGLRE
jgi:ketosteroid isomerase-like protein